MVKTRLLIILSCVVIIGIVAVVYLFPSDEKKIKKQVALLAEWASKEPGENIFTTVQKIKGIGTLFAERCVLKLPSHEIAGPHSRDEITAYATQARVQFSRIHLKFEDLTIIFPEKEVARVTLTGRLTGKWANGENVDESRELECILKKIDNQWLFTEFEVVEVLKK